MKVAKHETCSGTIGCTVELMLFKCAEVGNRLESSIEAILWNYLEIRQMDLCLI